MDVQQTHQIVPYFSSIPIQQPDSATTLKVSSLSTQLQAISTAKGLFSIVPGTFKQAQQASGLSDQFMVEMKDEEGHLHKIRGKRIENLNEAIVFHRLQKSKDPLSQFVPPFVGVIDADGSEINLADLLQQHTIEELCLDNRYQNCYILMADLAAGTSIAKDAKIRDFKFARPALQGQEIEESLHGRSPINFIRKIIRRLYFSLSGCSFAFQKSTKVTNWYEIVISSFKRAWHIRKTQEKLMNQFNRLEASQLCAVLERLTDMQSAVKRSQYVMTDASLLFIPTAVRGQDGSTVNKLNLHIIDLAHGLAEDEVSNCPQASTTHSEMRQELLSALTELKLNVGTLINHRLDNTL
jgi:hypothetical protein